MLAFIQETELLADLGIGTSYIHVYIYIYIYLNAKQCACRESIYLYIYMSLSSCTTLRNDGPLKSLRQPAFPRQFVYNVYIYICNSIDPYIYINTLRKFKSIYTYIEYKYIYIYI